MESGHNRGLLPALCAGQSLREDDVPRPDQTGVGDVAQSEAKEAEEKSAADDVLWRTIDPMNSKMRRGNNSVTRFPGDSACDWG